MPGGWGGRGGGVGLITMHRYRQQTDGPVYNQLEGRTSKRVSA